MTTDTRSLNAKVWKKKSTATTLSPNGFHHDSLTKRNSMARSTILRAVSVAYAGLRALLAISVLAAILSRGVTVALGISWNRRKRATTWLAIRRTIFSRRLPRGL